VVRRCQSPENGGSFGPLLAKGQTADAIVSPEVGGSFGPIVPPLKTMARIACGLLSEAHIVRCGFFIVSPSDTSYMPR
jgi:hypothetical protein